MSFTRLAEQILADAQVLDRYVQDNKLPQPTTDAGGPPFFKTTTPESSNALAALLANTHLLSHLAQGPASTWTGTMNGAAGDIMTNSAVYRFKIAEHVPPTGSAPFTTVAKACNLPLHDFSLIVRYAMTNFIFHEPTPNHIAHTAASLVLHSNPLIRSLAGMGADELFPALPSQLTVLSQPDHRPSPLRSAWAHANSATGPMFAELATNHPARATNMAFAMKTLATLIPPTVTTDAYPWHTLPPTSLIIDVGGGKGFACQALAPLFPDFRFIVQDLPSTISAAKAQCPPHLRERIQFEAHDFFDPQNPALNADVFFLRAVIHDWPDEDAIKILQALMPGMKRGARVIIVDPHTPDPKEKEEWWAERQVRASNLRMKLLFDSHDRERGEWAGLFERAGWKGGVRVVGVFARDGAAAGWQELVVVEGVWEG